MYLEDLIPAPNSKKINDIVKRVFGYNLKLESLDVKKAKSLKENFTKQLTVYENKLGSNCINNQTYTQLKLVNEVLDKHIAENSMSDEAHELVIYGENNQDLYRQRTVPIQRNLTKKWDRGVYDHDLAVKLWTYWAADAAQRYAAEYGSPDTKWSAMFPTSVRNEVAEKMADAWEEELEAGNKMEAREPYAVGMAAAMKSTGDKPPLKKSTIEKAHKIAKKIEKNEGINEDETEDAFNMIHQGIRDTLSKMSGQGSKFQVSMMRDHPKLSNHIYNTLVDLLQTMNSSLKNGKIVAESVIVEGELETAEAVMAAKNVVDRIQGMIEDLGEILNEDLPPLTDAIRDQMDSAQAEQYASAVSTAVMSALEAMRSTREAADSAARGLAGESVDTMGTDLAVAPETEPTMEPTTDMDAEAGDEFGAADAAQGGEAPMGREKRV